MPLSRTPLAQAIRLRGLDLGQVALTLGISRNSLQSYAQKTVPLPERHVLPLAALLGLSPDEIRDMGRTSVPVVARRLLREQGISYAGLPEFLGLTYNQTSAVLCGHRPMPGRVAEKLAELLDEPVERLSLPDVRA